jgi:phage FluMu gp28-like protein
MAAVAAQFKELLELDDPFKILDNLEYFAKYILHEEFHEGQKEVIKALYSGKYKTIVVCCGRRWGKSKLMSRIALHLACTNFDKKIAIVAPTYDQACIIFEELEELIERNWIINDLTAKIKRSPPLEIKFKTGSRIYFRSAEIPKNLRGRAYHMVIIDEAAFIDEDIIKNVIEPMLADYDGLLVMISTPWGKNHFYEAFLKGQQKLNGYISFRYPSWTNPFISRDYLERKKKDLGEDNPVWLQEYCAEFIDDVDAVFKLEHIMRNVINAEMLKAGLPNRRYAMGVDLAKDQDYTVITILDITEKPYQLVYFERFNRRPYTFVAKKIRELYEKFNRPMILLDQTGVGNAVIELVEDIAKGFKFTNESKLDLISKLIVAFENDELKIPNIPVLINELKYFRYVRTKTTLRMEAPPGMHDDCVISLALALYAAEESRRTPVVRSYFILR